MDINNTTSRPWRTGALENVFHHILYRKTPNTSGELEYVDPTCGAELNTDSDVSQAGWNLFI